MGLGRLPHILTMGRGRTNQWLIERLRLRQRTFVEFGADNYLKESNTRFLLTACGWRGLVLDGSDEHMRRLRRAATFCNYDVRAAQAFLTAENINETLTENGVDQTMGLLSIDVDGNDFWLWSAINVVRADVVVIEYNPRFGPTAAVVVPYDPVFARHKAHPSGFYYGASLEGLRRLGQRLGYRLVGCNRNGGNAFFAREELCEGAGLPGRTSAEAFAPASFSEVSGVDPDGVLLKTPPEGEARILASLDLPLCSVEMNGFPRSDVSTENGMQQAR